MTRATYVDPSTGEYVGEYETRDAATGDISRRTEWFATEREAATFARTGRACTCARHADGTTSPTFCPTHAGTDPCIILHAITGRRRRGTIRNGTCTACGWSA